MAKLYEIISLDTCDLLMPYIFHLIQEEVWMETGEKQSFPKLHLARFCFAGGWSKTIINLFIIFECFSKKRS